MTARLIIRRSSVLRDRRGAIGIGTLIIFIALVLVAAIAAAVIIRTAETLEEDAERTGMGASEDVSGGLQIEHIEGQVNAGNIDTVYVLSLIHI